MNLASPSENLFTLIRDKFDSAYKPGSPVGVGTAPDGQKFISGRLPDGGELGLYRLGVALMDGGPEAFRIQTAPDVPETHLVADDEIDEEEIDGNVRQYLVGGDERVPIGCEVTNTDPLETRLLESHEMAELVRKIGGTTFRGSLPLGGGGRFVGDVQKDL